MHLQTGSTLASLSRVSRFRVAETGMGARPVVRRLSSIQPTIQRRGTRWAGGRGSCAWQAAAGARAHGAGQPARAPAACSRGHNPISGLAATFPDLHPSATLPALSAAWLQLPCKTLLSLVLWPYE